MGIFQAKSSFHLININEIVQYRVHRKPGNRFYPGFPDNILPMRDHGMHRYMMLVGNLFINLPFRKGNQYIFLSFGKFVLIQQSYPRRPIYQSSCDTVSTLRDQYTDKRAPRKPYPSLHRTTLPNVGVSLIPLSRG